MFEQAEDHSLADEASDALTSLVHLLYAVALDPGRLGDFVAVWEAVLAVLPPAALPLRHPDFERHLRRARRFLDRLPAAAAPPSTAPELCGVLRVPAFLSDGIMRISACNRAAGSAFGIAPGAPLAALPFEAADVVTLSSTIRMVARRAQRPTNLRLRSSITGAPVILRVCPIDRHDARPQAMVISTDPVWPEGFGALLQETFGLTPAEVEIVRGLTLGLPIRDIAELRGRAVDTVRTQMRSIQSKTETHSQPELLRLVLGLMDIALHEGARATAGSPAGGALDPLPMRSLVLPDGRRMEWTEFGDPAGAPILHLHGDYGLARWLPAAERAARLRGLRVVVPVRAGYGRSHPLPETSDLTQGTALDLVALVDQLGISRCAVLALGADLRFALTLSGLRPRLVSGILGCALDLPPTGAECDASRDRWSRLLAGTGRASPEVLGFLVQAAAVQGRLQGKESALRLMFGASPADAAALRGAELRATLIAGTDICIGPGGSAHEAFTRSRLDAGQGWAGLLRQARVPVRLLHGEEDPVAPPQAVARFAAPFPALRPGTVPGAGRLLVLSDWQEVLDRLIPLSAR
ncbi:helix-turn-helix transcriptional regulator [Cereibacter sphaeroides]|uniref:helix-turn-helix transcriptional regulator n=1 Tax=Cereibacter sphaeroides TaxID=1063 RepID=UPI001F2523AB|nr:helix-turn-helix transcriptional regulator [Cereibacter sphaeroides]MCE6960225.1 helix-turn-helix transcriptional regulator [Cereibacter sphaeroides]MCE6969215.1 helix-turn-helix transcriptional regulator [Cereibacter sphaeroides]MCE6974836.1 helix-turn-helix transcriptional regulator [Cereibacter sphaeroides]